MSKTLIELLQEVKSLSTDEQLRLAAYLVEQAREAYTPAPRRKWRDIQGSIPAAALGEDAQAWVSRTRQEADERRRIRTGNP